MSNGVRGASWALLAGNVAIGCGVFAAAGTLNDLSRDLQVAIGLAGQLVTLGAVMMGLGAPLLALWLGGMDRRRLLTGALIWYALGHLACALAPGFAALLPLRALTMLGAAVFTPQAAAAIGALCDARGEGASKGRVITFIFLGWSLASVFGMPLHAYVAESIGWRWAFGGVAVLSAVTALWVWAVLPDGLRPAPMSLGAWVTTLRDRRLMALVAVTALSGAGQFTVFTYQAPYYGQQLGASAGQISALFFWFGAFGLLGSVLLTRWVERLGAAHCATLGLMLMSVSLALWPLAGSVVVMALVILPWGLGCFSTNSAQQARLVTAAPAQATALMAMNTSAIYVGQGLGAAGGGLMAEAAGLTALWPVALAWMGAALMLSARLSRGPGAQQ